jgi:hypothetical protein
MHRTSRSRPRSLAIGSDQIHLTRANERCSRFAVPKSWHGRGYLGFKVSGSTSSVRQNADHGCSSRIIGRKSRALGWESKHGKDEFLASFNDEVKAVAASVH